MNNRRLDDFTGTIEQYVAYLEAQVLKFRAILVGQGHNLSSPPLSPVLLLLEEEPTCFICFSQIPVHHHLGIYSPILPLEEGYRIQAFSRYPYLVQQVMSPASSFVALKLPH
jgi:hypothetical protein